MPKRTIEQIKDSIRNDARDLCDLSYNLNYFSDELALAAISLSTTLKFIHDFLLARGVTEKLDLKVETIDPSADDPREKARQEDL